MENLLSIVYIYPELCLLVIKRNEPVLYSTGSFLLFALHYFKRLRTSALVYLSSLNNPRIVEVTVVAPAFLTPRPHIQ